MFCSAWPSLHSAAPGGTLATLRERFGGATALAGLRITDVVIEGRANTPEPLLRAALGVSIGDPILGFSVEMARQRIETLSWVEHATVERRLPGTVVVVLQERRPFAIWQNQGKFVLIDRTGQVVANQNVAEFRQLPLVVGPGAPAAAATLIDALTDRPDLQKRVVAAVRVGERRWNLRLNNGADVMLPEGHEVAGARSADAASAAARAARSSARRDRHAARRSPRAAPATGREEANMNDMSRRFLPPPNDPDEPARQRHGRTGPFGVLDIGTTKIVCLIGRTESDGTLRALGFGWQRGSGVRGGGIVDLETGREGDPRLRSARPRTWPIRGFARSPSTSPAASRNRGCSMCSGRSADARWTSHDIRRVVNEGRARASVDGREVIHALPLTFTVDQTDGVADPRGLFCEELTARLHIVDAVSTSLRSLSACIARCDLDIAELVSAPMAAGLATLVADERELGATVIDMGGGTTGMAVFAEGQLLHTAQLPVGGVHVTNDLARMLSTPVAHAERLKTLYGNAQSMPGR